MPLEPSGSGGGSPGGGGGTIAGIPTKWLLIGGGAAVVAFFLIQKPGSSGGGSQQPLPSDAVYGQALGPNAALALGSLETQVLQQSGKLQEQQQGYYDQLSAQLSSGVGTLSSGISGVSTDIGGLKDIFQSSAADLSSGIAGVSDYQHAMERTILSLYLPRLEAEHQTRTQISQWFRDRFAQYGLETLPPGYFGPGDIVPAAA